VYEPCLYSYKEVVSEKIMNVRKKVFKAFLSSHDFRFDQSHISPAHLKCMHAVSCIMPSSLTTLAM